MSVPAKEIPGLLSDLLKVYKTNRRVVNQIERVIREVEKLLLLLTDLAGRENKPEFQEASYLFFKKGVRVDPESGASWVLYSLQIPEVGGKGRHLFLVETKPELNYELVRRYLQDLTEEEGE